jgi:hypothetical protein
MRLPKMQSLENIPLEKQPLSAAINLNNSDGNNLVLFTNK